MKTQYIVVKIAFAFLFCWLLRSSTQAQSVLLTPLHTFTSSADPDSLSISAVDGSLFGTTYAENNYGTIFTINRDGRGYQVLHNFTADDVALAGSAFEPGLNLFAPFAAPGSDGAIYGTTPGSNTYGSVFTLNPSGSGFKVLRAFTPDDDGHSPDSVIQGRDGVLYGAGNAVFRLDTDGSNYAVLHVFTNTDDGIAIVGKLLQATDRFLYGVAYYGGTNNDGTIFKVDTNGNNFQVLHSFGAAGDGQNPAAGLIQGRDGALYGTTFSGGTNSHGTIFKINADGSGYQVMHLFTGKPNDGSGPYASLVLGPGNVLYGTTYQGGANDQGAAFKIGSDGNGYVSLYSFSSGPIGTGPLSLVAGPSQGDTGVLYGVTRGISAGTVFAMIVNPPLSITPITGQSSSNQAAVLWPAWAVNYTLQSTTNLSSPTWNNVTDGVPVFGLQVTSTNPAVYYRLVSP